MFIIANFFLLFKALIELFIKMEPIFFYLPIIQWTFIFPKTLNSLLADILTSQSPFTFAKSQPHRALGRWGEVESLWLMTSLYLQSFSRCDGSKGSHYSISCLPVILRSVYIMGLDTAVLPTDSLSHGCDLQAESQSPSKCSSEGLCLR